MTITQAEKKPDVLWLTAGLAWNFVLGSSFFQFAVTGTPVAPLKSPIIFLFAVAFFYRWCMASPNNSEQLRKLKANRVYRIVHAVIEGLTMLWGAAGWGALFVAIWMIDTQQIVGEALQKAHEEWTVIFWMAVIVAVFFGGLRAVLNVWIAVLTRDTLPRDRGVVDGGLVDDGVVDGEVVEHGTVDGGVVDGDLETPP